MVVSCGHISDRHLRPRAIAEPTRLKITNSLPSYIVAASLFIAAAPAFREEMVGKIHATAAYVLGLCAIIWLLAIGGCPWIAILGVCIAVLDHKHFLFWVEVGLLYNLFISLMTVVVMNG